MFTSIVYLFLYNINWCAHFSVEYWNMHVASGRNKDVVDPDENLIYTRRKQRQEKLQTPNDPLLKESTVRFPSTGWSTSLQRMPLFTKAEMDLHVFKSGKNRAIQSQQA